jgi:anti-anti-sigma regulatory factor
MDTWLTHRSVRDLRPGDLAWLAFAGEEEQGHIIGPFIGGGLAGEDTVIYVTDAGPGELAGLPGLDGPAGRTGQETAAALTAHVERGRLRLIPWRRAALRDGHFDSVQMLTTLQGEIDRAASAGARGVRVTAEMSWAVRDAGVDRILECERQFGTAVAASTMITAICQVDRRNVTEAELDALRGAHEVIVGPNPEFEDPVLRITRTFHPRGLAIAGELDAARHAVFAEALASAASAGVVHLDCAELRFMDLGALNLLAGYVSGNAGRVQLVLDRVPRDLRGVIELVGWGRLPGVRLGDAVP